MWWKIAIPVLAIIVLLFKFHSGNFTAGVAGPNQRHTAAFMPFGIKGVLGAVVGAGIVFSYLGFEQADQLAGEIKNPQQEPAAGDHHRGADRHRHLHPVPDRLHRRDATRPADTTASPASRRSTSGPLANPATAVSTCPFAAIAGLVGLGWLAVILRHRRLRLPVRHRPDLPDLDLAGQLRPGQEPVLPADLPAHRQARRAVGQPDPLVRGRPASSCCRSRAGRRWSAWSPGRACSCTRARRSP